MKRTSAVITIGLIALLGWGALASAGGPAAGGQRSDFALFDGTDPTSGETGVACGARLGSSTNPVAFTYYVAVSNFSETVKIIKVLYADGVEQARYQVPPFSSFSFQQAAGGTAGIDDAIRVFAEGPTPSGLAGSMSILAPAAARAHPLLGGANLCVTLTTPAP
jgi:hypothetical protein